MKSEEIRALVGHLFKYIDELDVLLPLDKEDAEEVQAEIEAIVYEHVNAAERWREADPS